jgi:DnaJ-class molecular chaperone
MKDEDLWKECPECKGEGIKITTARGMTSSGPCTACKGLGGEITELGSTLRRFWATLRKKGLLG